MDAVAPALQVALNLIGASAGVMLAVGALLSLLIGFEAATLRRFTLARRRWTNVGIVVGDDLESAERRFYDAWAANDRATNASLHRPPVFRRPQSISSIIRIRRHRLVPGTRSVAVTVAIVDYGSGNLTRRRKRSSAPRAKKG
jgi:hypothetical protein